MKNFLAIYIGTAASRERSEWGTMDEAKRKDREATGIKAWGDWMTTHKAAIVESGEARSERRSAWLRREFRIRRTI